MATLQGYFEADKSSRTYCKHHGLAKLTGNEELDGGNGRNRGASIQKIGESLADLCLVFKTTLQYLMQSVFLQKTRPQGGDLKDVKKIDTVIAGVNQVAVDSYGLPLFGMRDRSGIRQGRPLP